MTISLRKRGMVDIEVFGKKTTLHATFENIALFEQISGTGLYALANRFGNMDIRQTDLVYVLWAFSVDRDKDGWTKNDISDALIEVATPQDIIQVVESFMMLVFGAITSEDAPEEAAAPKKARARRTVK